MEQNIFNLNNKIYSNNNNILLEIINDLNKLLNYTNDNLIIKILENSINKMNYIINENKKNVELIRNDISLLYNKLNKRLDKLEINNRINQEIKYNNGDRSMGDYSKDEPIGKHVMLTKNREVKIENY